MRWRRIHRTRLAIETLLYWIEEVLPRLRRRPAFAYPLAFAIFLVALAIRFAVDPLLTESLPYLTFFVPVLIATLIAGIVPALTTVGLSALAALYFFIEPRHSLVLTTSSAASLVAYITQGLFLVLVGHVINVLVERLSRERRRSEDFLRESADAERGLAELNSELRHRFKNVFTVIVSLLGQTARHVSDSEELVRSVSGRLAAMSEGQDLLTASRFEGADFRQLCESALSPLVPPGDSRLALIGSATQVQVGPEHVVPLTLLLHELATNAVKYGAWSSAKGTVEVSWTPSNGGEPRLQFWWKERGGPSTTLPTRRGFGSTLIERILPDAHVVVSYLPDGLHCEASLPIPAPSPLRAEA